MLCNLFSCAGLSDWEYELPQGYCIIRVNSCDIHIGSNNGVKVDRFIVSFCYNDRYVCAKRVEVSENDSYDDIMSMVPDDAFYCIVDTITNKVYDRLNTKQFEELCTELEVYNLCDWIDTTTKPDGAK